MSKRTKILGLVASIVSGSWLFGCGCSLPKLGCGCGPSFDLAGFCKGIFTKGMVDQWCIDMIFDWLQEDLFS